MIPPSEYENGEGAEWTRYDPQNSALSPSEAFFFSKAPGHRWINQFGDGIHASFRLCPLYSTTIWGSNPQHASLLGALPIQIMIGFHHLGSLQISFLTRIGHPEVHRWFPQLPLSAQGASRTHGACWNWALGTWSRHASDYYRVPGKLPFC